MRREFRQKGFAAGELEVGEVEPRSQGAADKAESVEGVDFGSEP